MDVALTQDAIESALALAADSDHTQAAAKACCAHPEIAIQLDRLVAAIMQQTQAHREIGASIVKNLQTIYEAIDDVTGDGFSAGYRRQERKV
ncbi:MAG: hypothetical protein Q8M20_04545 [Rhodocyclaceae bacterium]|nr:hypothetical protein [Rhodocyclaceae bacterium]MDZ4214028.1 hypothetical protein [Rhodocyclaceae bacterium]